MKALAILLLIFGALVAGCITNAATPYIGTYHSERLEKHRAYTLVIQDDGTYIETTHDYNYEVNYTEKGVYVIKNGEMQRTGTFGITNIMKLDNGNMTDQDGLLWVRQK